MNTQTPTRVSFDVFGPFLWGSKKGHTNPKAHATLVYTGKDFAECKSKIQSETDGAIYRVQKVDKWDGETRQWIQS